MRRGAILSIAGLTALLAAPATAQSAADAPYHFALAKILLDEGEYLEAGRNLRLAIEGAPSDPYLRLEYAGFLLNSDDADGAVEQLEVARELAPGDVAVLKGVGRLLLQAARSNEGAFAAARLTFERLREMRPEDQEILSTLGRIYLSEQRYPEAAGVFGEALVHWPQSRSMHGSRIDALLRAGATAEAGEAIESFLEVDPTSIRARLTLFDLRQAAGDSDGALEALRSTPEESVADPDLLRRLAVTLYESGAFSEALYWLDRSLKSSGSEVEDDPQGIFLRALLLTAEGRSDGAMDELRRLLDAHPDRHDALQLLVRHLFGASRWQEAVDLTSSRLSDGSLPPELAEIALLHAEALRELERGDEALDWLARAAAVPELRSRALARQAGTLLGLSRGPEADEVLRELTAEGGREALMMAAEVCQREESYERSLPFLEQIVAEDDTELQALFWLGAAYERTGRKEEAENQFRRFLEQQPDSAPVLNYLGYMWAESGVNLQEALDLVERAVALDPDNGAYVDSLGWAHYQLGNYEEARDHLERAARLVEEDAVVLEHLADVYQVLGRYDEAVELYRRVLGLGAENAAQVEAKLRELASP